MTTRAQAILSEPGLVEAVACGIREALRTDPRFDFCTWEEFDEGGKAMYRHQASEVVKCPALVAAVERALAREREQAASLLKQIGDMSIKHLGQRENDALRLEQMRAALERLLDEMDDEVRVCEPTCNECTQGQTPIRFDEGPCSYHQMIAALAPAADAKETTDG